MEHDEHREGSRELFERLDTLMAEYEAVRQDIYNQYSLLVAAALDGKITGKENLENLLYGMSDFFGDERFILLGESLADYLYGVYPEIPRAMGYAQKSQDSVCGQGMQERR